MTTSPGGKKKKMERDIQARVTLPAGDPLNEKFRAILADTGIHSYAEALRFLVKRYRVRGYKAKKKADEVVTHG